MHKLKLQSQIGTFLNDSASRNLSFLLFNNNSINLDLNYGSYKLTTGCAIYKFNIF
jgi:hypothetical protein